MPLAMPPKDLTDDVADDEQRALAAMAEHRRWGTGYSKQQSTRPQTVGYGLVDSPVAQMAWIIEKFWSWMDCNGHPENVLSRDELLDNVMMYWATGSGASSARLYWESLSAFAKVARVEVPTGVAAFPKEVLPAPRRWCEPAYNITHWSDMPRGGHFAAFEQPELFVDDVRAFFATVR
jgi:pimeloyl-ACP methyl ester carboxylesterase